MPGLPKEMKGRHYVGLGLCALGIIALPLGHKDITLICAFTAFLIALD